MSLSDKEKIERYERYQKMMKKNRIKRECRIRLERKRYEEGVASGVIEPVTEEEIDELVSRRLS